MLKLIGARWTTLPPRQKPRRARRTKWKRQSTRPAIPPNKFHPNLWKDTFPCANRLARMSFLWHRSPTFPRFLGSTNTRVSNSRRSMIWGRAWRRWDRGRRSNILYLISMRWQRSGHSWSMSHRSTQSRRTGRRSGGSFTGVINFANVSNLNVSKIIAPVIRKRPSARLTVSVWDVGIDLEMRCIFLLRSSRG